MKSYSAKFLWSQTALIAHNGGLNDMLSPYANYLTPFGCLTLSLSSSNMLRNTNTFRRKIKHITKSSIREYPDLLMMPGWL